MNPEKFAIFILSHGNCQSVHTYNTLKKQGYTGRIYLILDDLDPDLNNYITKFGIENIFIFNKKEVSERIDVADNFGDMLAVVYARNVCFNIAKDIGLDHFGMFDDDYTKFRYTHNSDMTYVTRQLEVKNLDLFFDCLVDFVRLTGVDSIAIGQGGDFIGGRDSHLFKNKVKRKCMNTFICSTSKPFDFYGKMNEDVTTYVHLGSKGRIFLTSALGRMEQVPTQKSGGMSATYSERGTYVKSFYTILYNPSSVKIGIIGKHQRLHHVINWNKTVPKIISENYKKL